MQDWSYQSRCVRQCLDALAEHTRVIFASVTGSGKTQMAAEIIADYVGRGELCAMYTARRILQHQLKNSLRKYGLEVGIIGSDGAEKANYEAPVQVVMDKTAKARKGPWRDFLSQVGLVLIDEAHMVRGSTMKSNLRNHANRPFHLLGITATPVGLGKIYNHMVLGPSPRDLEAKHKVIVPLKVYAPSEIIFPPSKGNSEEFDPEVVEKTLAKYRNVLIGDVIEHYHRLNPFHLPAVCFAPTVKVSRWLAEDFSAKGVASEHMDASTPQSVREEIFERWKLGQTKIVVNCAVLREGFDFPGLYHAIICQPVKSLANWIQIMGRVRRTWKHKSHGIVTDHVGNYYRHPDALYYHDWRLDDNHKTVTERNRKKYDKSVEDEKPSEIKCMDCDLNWKPTRDVRCCPECGAQVQKPKRKIRQTNGELKLIEELPYNVRNEFADGIVLKRHVIICGTMPKDTFYEDGTPRFPKKDGTPRKPWKVKTVRQALDMAEKQLGRRPTGTGYRMPDNAREYLMPVTEFWPELFRKDNHGES